MVALETCAHWAFPAPAFKRVRQVGAGPARCSARRSPITCCGCSIRRPASVPAAVPRVRGEIHLVTDIAMRMLRPRELARAQGFPDSYVIDRTADGRR
jgi:site-specific DNA-cytosine methylase